jgi:LuxR family maltose regulon positive regulatory protein
VLRRTRLHKRVERVRNGGVITLVAGPGYGKTSYIVDFFASVRARKAYVALDEGDRDPLRFLRYLSAGLGIDLPEESSSLPFSGPTRGGLDAAVLEYAGSIVEHAGERPGERTVLAIDDLHLAEPSPQLCTALAFVVRGLPPGWTVILSSRRPMPLQLDGLSLGGRLVRVEPRQLRLTPSEVAVWAAKNWHVELEPADVRAVWRLTQGWPAALVLLGRGLVADGPAVGWAGPAEVVAQGNELRTYLREDVLGGLEQSAAEVLLTAGLFPQVVFPRDSSLLGGLALEAEAALEELAATGYFVTRAGRRRYVVHPLVRGLAETEARLHKRGITLMEKVASHLEQEGEHHHSARLYQRAGRQGDASRSLRSLVLSTLNAAASPRSEELQDLVSGWNIEEGTSEPWLLVAKARILQEEADYSGAKTLYEEAARFLSELGDRPGLLPVLLSSAFCLSVQGLWEESLSVLKRCWSVASTGEERAEV